MSDQERPAIVLTDAAPELAKNAPCPRCSAPAKERTASNGFGATYIELCGRCGYTFGEKRRA